MIIIPTGDLVGVINDVIPFAWPDAELPTLNTVRLRWDGEQLDAMTTDRFRLAIPTWRPGDVGPGEEFQDELGADFGSADDPWSMTMPLAQAKEIVKVFKLPPKEGGVPLTFDYDTDRFQAKVARSKETGYSGLSLIAYDTREDFPDLSKIVADAKPQPAAAVAYSAKWLADFAKVRPRGPMVLTPCGTHHLTLVTIGARFTGGIVPQRTDTA